MSCWCCWQLSCHHEERGQQGKAEQATSPEASLEPLDLTGPAQVCPRSFQRLETISCTFCLSQCELGLLSLTSKRALALPSLLSSGPQLWKRGIVEKLQGLPGLPDLGTSRQLMGSKSPQVLSLSEVTRSSTRAAPHTPSQFSLYGWSSQCPSLPAFQQHVALTLTPHASSLSFWPSFKC